MTQNTPFATRFDKVKQINTIKDHTTRTDKTKISETNIYNLIDKYGVKSLMQKQRPEHELFIDTTVLPKNLSLAEAIEQKNQFTEYFKAAPAPFRKIFKDNPDQFYESYKLGEFDKLLETGAMTQSQIDMQIKAIKNSKYDIYREILKEEELKNAKENKNISDLDQNNQISS